MALLAPEFIPGNKYLFQTIRHLMEHIGIQEGVYASGDLAVSQRATGANMSVDVAAGAAWVKGDTGTRQGLYHVVNDALVNLTVSAAHSTNPRLDQVILVVNDSSVSGASNTPELKVLAGTATSGATLDNRNGAASLPSNAIRLADILVAAADTSITTAEIRDRRPRARGFKSTDSKTADTNWQSSGGDMLSVTGEFSGAPVLVIASNIRYANFTGVSQVPGVRIAVDSTVPPVGAYPATLGDAIGNGVQTSLPSLHTELTGLTAVSAGRHKIAVQANGGGDGSASAKLVGSVNPTLTVIELVGTA